MSKRPSILGILYYGDRGFIVTAILHDSANYTSLLLQLLSGKCHIRAVTCSPAVFGQILGGPET